MIAPPIMVAPPMMSMMEPEEVLESLEEEPELVVEPPMMESEEVLEYLEEEPELVYLEEGEEVVRFEEENVSMEEGLEATTTTNLRGSNGNN
jgi:hypothetical protein